MDTMIETPITEALFAQYENHIFDGICRIGTRRL
jgi:hypothetical protein